MDPFGSDNMDIVSVQGGDWDNMAARVDFTYEVPAAEEGGDPTVKTSAALAYKPGARISAYRGNYYGSDEGAFNVFGVVDLYVLNNLTYVCYINDEAPIQGDLTVSTTLKEVISADGLTRYVLMYYASSKLLAEMQYSRTSTEEDWTFVTGYTFGTMYSMY